MGGSSGGSTEVKFDRAKLIRVLGTAAVLKKAHEPNSRLKDVLARLEARCAQHSRSLGGVRSDEEFYSPRYLSLRADIVFVGQFLLHTISELSSLSELLRSGSADNQVSLLEIDATLRALRKVHEEVGPTVNQVARRDNLRSFFSFAERHAASVMEEGLSLLGQFGEAAVGVAQKVGEQLFGSGAAKASARNEPPNEGPTKSSTGTRSATSRSRAAASSSGKKGKK